MKLAHVSAVSSSLENAERFYKVILGLTEVKSGILEKTLVEQLFDISCECRIVLYANEEISIEVFIPDELPARVPSFIHHCLEVDGKEQFLARCRDAGLHVNLVPKGEKLLSFVTDFDGNLYEITGE